MTTSKLAALFLAVFAITLHAQTAATIPYTCDFEDAAERGKWTLENGVQTNQWFIGTAAANAGSYGLYISNDNGATNAYVTTASYVYAYRSINFTSTGNYTISFNWKSAGYGSYDNLRAFLVPDDVTTLTAGNANGNTSGTNNVPPDWIAVSEILNGRSAWWENFSASVNVTSAGTYKLVFFWKNNYFATSPPPAAVDDISVTISPLSATVLTYFGYLTTPYTQPAAQTVTITNGGANAVTLTQPTSTNFIIGTLSTTNLASGATATFTVRPKASLAAGIYSETITISGSNGTSATVSANFIVMPAGGKVYYITGGSGSFSASTASAGGTAIANGTGAIQSVLDAIRTDANGNPVVIQFGNGTNTLDISTANITFDGSASPAWGNITLAGKITSTIYLTNNASIASTADIAGRNYAAIYNNGTGTVTISGGTVSGTVHNTSTGKVNINGGTVAVDARNYDGVSIAIYNESTGTVNISGGTVSTTSSSSYDSYTVRNYSTGVVTISGGTVTATRGCAVLNSGTGTVSISGGTVQNTDNAISNSTDGTVSISGGTVTATGYGGYAVLNSGTGTVSISGGTVENTSNDAGARAIFNSSTGTVNISGGEVKATNGYAIYKTGTGATSITGGLVFAYGTAVADVIYGNYDAASGNPAIIAWNSAAGTTTYTAFASDNIATAPEEATAAWLNKNGRAGIDYENGTNTGFIPLAVTVNKANPTPWPTAAPITYGAALSTSALSGGASGGTFAWEAPATIPTVSNSGYRVTFTPADAANCNAQTQTVAITVYKANSLAIQTPVSHQMISKGDLAENTFDLTTITLNHSDHGTLSYSLGAFADVGGGNDILASAPALSGHTLTYTGTGKESGTATQVINIASGNYTDIQVTITFEATNKAPVAIGGITPQNSVVYDGSPQKGYTGTPSGTLEGGAAYTGGFIIAYAGTDYDSTATPPTNAGEYTLKILVPSNNAYYTGELRHEFTIAKATYDLAGVSFPSQSLTYTGEPRSIFISGTLPAGVTVSYTGNGQTAINETGYTVTANFTGDAANHNPIPPLTATMIINNKLAYDMSGIVFADKTAAYTGEPQSIFISGELPAGVTVSYTGNGQTAVGTYTVTANFAVANPSTHNTPAPKTAELRIVEPTPIFTARENPKIGKIGIQTIGKAILLENLPTNAKVEVYNLQGKRVYSAYTSGNPQILKILVQTGIYVLKINTQTMRIAVK